MKATGIPVLLVIAIAFAPAALAGRTEPIKNPSDIPIAWNIVRLLACGMGMRREEAR
jgi:hypothetical protein